MVSMWTWDLGGYLGTAIRAVRVIREVADLKSSSGPGSIREIFTYPRYMSILCRLA